MSIWLKEYFARAMVFTVMATSVTAISAASIERIHSLDNESASTQNIAIVRENQLISHELEKTQSSDAPSYGTKALQSLFVLSKAGLKIAKSALKFVRRNPGKALTMALAMQNKTSSFRIPSTEALSVTNSFQNITSDNTTVTLLPMAISGNKAGVSPESNATFVLMDKNAGNLSSCNSAWPQTFSNGIWNTYGDTGDVNSLLYCFLVTRAAGYLDTIYINSLFIDLAQSTNTAQGMIILDMPSTSDTTQSSSSLGTTTSPSNILSTSQITQSSPIISIATTTSESSSTVLTNQSSSAIKTENNNSSNASVSRMTQLSSTANSIVTTQPPTLSQHSTTPVNSSSVASQPTPTSADGATTNGSDASLTPFGVPTSKPPYAIIIGSAVGGSLALCSIIAGVVAWVRGWCGVHKASSSGDKHNQELGVQHSSNKDGTSNYGLIIVAQPQSPKKSEYEEAPAATTMGNQFYESIHQPLT